MVTIEFKFNLGDRVKIFVNKEMGKVIGLYLNEDARKKAHIEYVDRNGLITSHWIREDELGKIE